MNNINVDDTLKTHFLNLYSIALCDFQIDTTELALLYRIGKENDVDPNDIDKIILHPDLVKFSIPTDILKKIEYLYDFARMIWADKIIEDAEEEIMNKFIVRFGFDKSNSRDIAKFLIDEAKKYTSKSDVIDMVNQILNS